VTKDYCAHILSITMPTFSGLVKTT